MSVAYVENHPAAVTVADEIESFFHVLLFYAVRLLNHNIDLVAAFIVDYFDSFRLKKGRDKRTCSPLKWMTMMTGKLFTPERVKVEFYTDSSFRERHTRFETLLAKFLRFFRARYEVIEWARHVKAAHTKEEEPEGEDEDEDEGKEEAKEDEEEEEKDEEDEDEDEDEDEEESLSALYSRRLGASPSPVPSVDEDGGEPEPTKAPSDNTKATAALLDDHAPVLRLLWGSVKTSLTSADGRSQIRWPRADAVTDRLASGSGYDPRPHILALGELQKSIEAHTSTHMDGPPPLKKMKSSASGSIEPRIQLVVQRSLDSDSSRGPRKRRSRKGKARV
ncbi:hypothetical protein C8Q78DRAFT_391357 [Trametes maxima]|nr:hypothetical protein C8Q78DRAFT_391357 [Trametes maxima]